MGRGREREKGNGRVGRDDGVRRRGWRQKGKGNGRERRDEGEERGMGEGEERDKGEKGKE